jgi:hypothetical protein
MEVNISIRGEEKFQAFIEEFATIDFEAAKKDLETQFLADEKANKYVLTAENAKDGAEHIKNYMGVAMSYDAQGTQIGGGKAYLDKGQEIVRKDVTIVFM